MTLWRRIFEERRSVILPLGIALAVNAVTLLLAVWPLQASVTASQETARQATLALATAKRLERQATEAKASKVRADDEIRKFYGEVLPASLAEARKTTNSWLQQAANDAGLIFKGSHLDVTDVRESQLSRAFSKVTLQGRYSNIRSFLYTLETAKEFIIVERVELTSSGTDQPAANGLLEITLLVATYFNAPAAR